MTLIIDLHAREILDSRGNPTVEVDVLLDDGSFGRAAVPSGASTGAHEAAELRDGDKARYHGKGVLKAVEAVNGEIADAILGMDAEDQRDIDMVMIELDGTQNKSPLGANAILGVSLAVAKAAADARGLPLYRYVGGSLRACPAGADDEHHQWRRTCRQPDRHPGIHGHAGGRGQPRRGRALGRRNLPHAEKGPGAEGPIHLGRRRGRLCARSRSTRDALDFIMDSIEKAGFEPGEDVVLALDCAATEFYRDGSYEISGEEALARRRADGRISRSPVPDYPISSIEDGMAEDDFEGWKALTERIGATIQLVGDDLFVTNPARLSDGIERGLANSLLVKVNQIGTLSETLDAVDIAHARGLHLGDESTARARPRTRPLPISRSRPIAGRSRPARWRARTGWRSTTS